MASRVINEIKECIKHGHNFLLSGGAGSGKTYTLMQTLDEIFLLDKKARVACITYTNVAVAEIESRSSHKSIRASTIHDFLWSCIKGFQKNLRIVLSELITENEIKINSNSEFSQEEFTYEFFAEKTISYKEYRKLEEGIISHDDVLVVSNRLFKNYSLLCKIVFDRYQYILIDEYQDSEPRVLEIFLDFMQNIKKANNFIGLFGDSMQSIYNHGIGDIKKYIEDATVKEIIKEDNYRCSKSVIKLLNKIRTDIRQEPSNDNVGGSIKFLYTDSEDMFVDKIKELPLFASWDFTNTGETKELYLTNRLIAKQQGFEEIYRLFPRDRLLGDNKDSLSKHLFKIQEVIFLYESRKFNDFIAKTDFHINKLSDKQNLKNNIEELKSSKNKSIHEVIITADKFGLVKIDDTLRNYIDEKNEVYDNIKTLNYSEVINAYNYEEGFSPYSSQHGVKGAEFDNVLVILDNGNWNQYNFKYLFEEEGNQSVITRTEKIFYVCCSRVKNNLVVAYENPSHAVVEQAKVWFGEDNVIKV